MPSYTAPVKKAAVWPLSFALDMRFKKYISWQSLPVSSYWQVLEKSTSINASAFRCCFSASFYFPEWRSPKTLQIPFCVPRQRFSVFFFALASWSMNSAGPFSRPFSICFTGARNSRACYALIKDIIAAQTILEKAMISAIRKKVCKKKSKLRAWPETGAPWVFTNMRKSKYLPRADPYVVEC